jgi:hypothetical protein
MWAFIPARANWTGATPVSKRFSNRGFQARCGYLPGSLLAPPAVSNASK